MPKIYTDQEIESAKKLASSTTSSAVVEHLNSWLSVKEGHKQYDIKDREVRIAKLALDMLYAPSSHKI